MSTGLLDELKEKYNMNYKQWLKESIIRLFGICIWLRDDNYLTEEQIYEKLKERDNTQLFYVQRDIERYRKEIDSLKEKLSSNTIELALQEYDEQMNNYNLAVEKAMQEIKNYEPIKHEQAKLLIALANNQNDLIRSITDTVKRQFEISEEDVEDLLKRAEWLKPTISREEYPEYYKNNLQNKLDRAYCYYKDAKENLKNYKSLAEMYKEYCKAIDELDI